jgi:PPOX class probable F420-dependent enzyme
MVPTDPTRPDAAELLARARYLLLTTFRKDGTGVPTPVWSVPVDGELWVWTAPDAGKTKRVRRNPIVSVVPCGVRGKPHGTPVPARGELVDTADAVRVMPALIAKYGWQARLSLLGHRYRERRGRDPRVAAIRLTVPTSAT